MPVCVQIEVPTLVLWGDKDPHLDVVLADPPSKVTKRTVKHFPEVRCKDICTTMSLPVARHWHLPTRVFPLVLLNLLAFCTVVLLSLLSAMRWQASHWLLWDEADAVNNDILEFINTTKSA